MSSASPYAAPKSTLFTADESTIHAHKRSVVLAPTAEWPNRCFKCNEHTSSSKSVKVDYVNPWIYLSLLITPIITIILALIFQKKFTIELPVCEKHLRKRRNFVMMQWLVVVLIVAGIAGGIVIESEIMLAFAIFMVLVLVIMAIGGRMVYAAKFKNDELWVRGVGKPFLNSLPPLQR